MVPMTGTSMIQFGLMMYCRGETATRAIRKPCIFLEVGLRGAHYILAPSHTLDQ